MPIFIALAVAAVVGLTMRENQVLKEEQAVRERAAARTIAASDPNCQAELRTAQNDSVRAVIVQSCVDHAVASRKQ
ncbi:MAG TPA: hypothetical protein VJU87_05415 [Gemmatimonadaceae bacterium]|nr:hypothetical protein [Gemmatimonadaceae bacterium]